MMTTAVDGAANRRYEAPRQTGERFVNPAPVDWDALWLENDARVANLPPLVAGWREAARREFRAAALNHTRQYRDADATVAHLDRVVLAGHQPSLFHPGVWYKNFLLDQLAHRFAACPVQLIIDNDLYRQSAIRVPSGAPEHPRVEYIPFDRLDQTIPFERAAVSDESLFRTFGSRVAQQIRPMIDRPLIQSYWPCVQDQYRRTENVGLALSSARNILESDHGLKNLELPLSHLGRTRTFHQFIAHLIARGPEFAQLHNAVVNECRRRRRLRSANHPVPNLAVSPDAIEVPLWVWSKTAPARKRLYMREVGGKFTVFDRDSFTTRASNEDALVEQLMRLEADGVSVRPRALVTTMYARLILSDLFIHGIGGASYDEVTDDIIRRFFSAEPPRFLTATATFHLPVDAPDVDRHSLIQFDADFRSMRFHPENYVDSSAAETRQWILEKRDWISRQRRDANLKQRHDAIERINERLYALLANRLNALRQRRTALVDEIQTSVILKSREYSFTLFPPSLVEQLQALARGPK